MKTYGNVEIEGGGEIINADIDNGTADPTGTGPGELFYRTDLGQLRVYSGTSWSSVLTSASDVTSILGTANQITASPTTGNVTLAFAPNIVIPAPTSGETLLVNGLANNPVATFLVIQPHHNNKQT